MTVVVRSSGASIRYRIFALQQILKSESFRYQDLWGVRHAVNTTLF